MEFVREINCTFGTEYLRCPNESDINRILAINAGRGFTGCLGRWDGELWKLKNCPVAWTGQCKGK